ncbi:transposase [Fusobacterium sp. PH5-44]|uniref:transposase n=1 Tax=unclassified Fusobacterium TaxID=2648384 RepID=UPI003D1DA160
MTCLAFQKSFDFEFLCSFSPDVKFFCDLFDCLELPNLSEFEHKTGRPPISRTALIRIFIVDKIKRFEHTSQLIEFLKNNHIIVNICGLTKRPSDSTLYNFETYFNKNIIDEIFESNNKILFELGIVDFKNIIVDSTSMETDSPINNKKSFAFKEYVKNDDPNSHDFFKFSVHTASNEYSSKKNTNYYLGCKEHVLIDAKNGIPIANFTSPANIPDLKAIHSLMEKADPYIDFNSHTKYLVADKGYDDSFLYDELYKKYNIMLIAPLKGNKKQKLLVSKVQYCEAGLRMHKCGTVKRINSIRHKFRCPFATSKHNSCPINNPNFSKNAKTKGCIRWFSVKVDNLRNHLDRDSSFFKKLYRKRILIEQYNARFKALGNKKIYVKSQNAIEISNKISHITTQLLAILAFRKERLEDARSLSKLLKAA